MGGIFDIVTFYLMSDISDDSDAVSSQTDSESDGENVFDNDDSDSEDADDNFIGFGQAGQIPAFTWDQSDRARVKPIPDFAGPDSGPTHPLPEGSTAHKYFEKFIDDQLLTSWCDFSNTYAEYQRTNNPNKHKGEWSKPTLPEMKAFLAILITVNYGLTPARLAMLWTKKSSDWLYHTCGFWKILSEKRYRQIKRYLQVTPPLLDGPPSRDKLRKVRQFLRIIQARFENEFVPGENLSIDECMVPFKGRWQGKQYIRAKPVKWGIKVDILADWKTGYNYRFRVYTGKVAVPPDVGYLGVLAYLVAQLLLGLEDKGYKVALDRGYSSPYLFEYLATKGIGAVGTCVNSRKGYPKELKKKKSQCRRGEWEWLRSDNLLAVRWCDKAPIYFLSNYHYPDNQQVSRKDKRGQANLYPATSAVVDYNLYMNAVDKLDQNTILDKRRKQYKWYMRLVLKVIEWCIYNAYILDQQDRCSRGDTGAGHRKRDMLAFRQELGMALVASHPIQKQGSRKRLATVASEEERLSNELPHTPVIGEGRDHTCSVCYERHKKYKRKHPDSNYKTNPMKAVKTVFKCQTCNAYLCIKKDSTCWQDYHSKVEFWRPLPWDQGSPVHNNDDTADDTADDSD